MNVTILSGLIKRARLNFKPLLFICLVIAIVVGFSFWVFKTNPSRAASAVSKPVVAGKDQLQLTAEQAKELNVGAVAAHAFEQRRAAVGIIDFNQDKLVQVYSPYQGRIAQFPAKAGDDVVAGQLLFSVQIPDLAQAASSVISAAGNLKMSNETLTRAKNLYATQSIAQKELQQNITDQQSADAAYRAARKTLTLFGLSNSEMDEIERSHKVDTEMAVRSPLAGRVTARVGAVGQLVQPGSAPAPISVANIDRLWMVANVPESELAAYRVGQSVRVQVQAYPEAVFSGKLSYIGDTVDPNTHRVVVRASVRDIEHKLKPQMLANFTISLGHSAASPFVPVNAIARESDGTSSTWVTADGLRFKRRSVKTGMMQDGKVQILEGLMVGEKIAQDKALFLSNLYLISLN